MDYISKRFISALGIYISSHLTDSEYGAGKILEEIKSLSNVIYKDDLHLSVSMRSFRAKTYLYY